MASAESLASASAAAPEYLVVYEMYPPGVEYRGSLADEFQNHAAFLSTPIHAPTGAMPAGGGTGRQHRRSAGRDSLWVARSPLSVGAANHAYHSPHLLLD